MYKEQSEQKTREEKIEKNSMRCRKEYEARHNFHGSNDLDKVVAICPSCTNYEQNVKKIPGYSLK